MVDDGRPVLLSHHAFYHDSPEKKKHPIRLMQATDNVMPTEATNPELVAGHMSVRSGAHQQKRPKRKPRGREEKGRTRSRCPTLKCSIVHPMIKKNMR